MNPSEEQNTLTGQQISLRPATLDDRTRIYEWLAHSDVTPLMLGLPLFPEQPVPTWEEFCEDYLPHFFDGSAPEHGRCFLILRAGEPIGQINHNDILEAGPAKRVELDLWMRSRAWCGRGFGPDALDTLCRYLTREFGITEFMVQPSQRNPAAIRAYEKAGFRRLEGDAQEIQHTWGPADYPDSVFLVRVAASPPSQSGR